MQTQTLVSKTRQLCAEMKEVVVSQRFERTSPDLMSALQKRMDALTTKVSNPTLACFEDLADVAKEVGLNTKDVNAVVSQGRYQLSIH